MGMPPGTQVWLAAVVQNVLERSPFGGHAFVFRGRRR
jgi:transposase